MKKVMIVASTELEPVIVQRLSETGKVQFREVPSTVVEGYEGLFKHTYDYDELKNQLENQVQVIARKTSKDETAEPDASMLKQFAYNPKRAIEDTIESLETFGKELDRVKEPYDRVVRSKDRELESVNTKYETENREITHNILVNKAKLKSLEALDPAQLKACLTAGVVNAENKAPLEEYLGSAGISFKSEELTDTEHIVFIFDSAEALTRVKNIFTVYEVEDIYEVFESGELLLLLDEEKMKATIEEYNATIAALEKKTEKTKTEHEEEVEAINKKYVSELEPVEKKYKAEFTELIAENGGKIAAAQYIIDYLTKYSETPVLRNPVVSILYAWLDADDTKTVSGILDDLRGDDDLLYKIEDIPSKELKEAKRDK